MKKMMVLNGLTFAIVLSASSVNAASLDETIASSLMSHPDVKQAYDNYVTRNHLIDQSKAGYYPKIVITSYSIHYTKLYDPDSAKALADIIMNAKTILWNGPVGVFEFDQFAKGTEIIAKAIAESPAFSIAGGGDTLAAIDKFGIADKVSYISTGGGAFLEFVEGKKLPAVAILEERAKA